MAPDRSSVHTERPLRRRDVVFRVLPTLVVLVLAAVFWRWWSGAEPVEAGQSMNRGAWEASFLERGEPVPPQGPREGYWGSRLGKKAGDTDAGWREGPASVPDLLDIRDNGTQVLPCDGCPTLLFSGGSVAFGAYASTIEATWFAVLQRDLETQVRIVVFAAGAWKTEQELIALRRAAPHESPHTIVMVTGLNDLTNGFRAQDRYFDTPVGADGVAVGVGSHDWDWQARVQVALQNIAAAQDVATEQGARFAVVLQPALFAKARRTEIEEELLAASVQPYGGAEGISAAYDSLARELAATDIRTVDCRQPFDLEVHTTFADLWHFADRGHALLARCIADGLPSLGAL